MLTEEAKQMEEPTAVTEVPTEVPNIETTKYETIAAETPTEKSSDDEDDYEDVQQGFSMPQSHNEETSSSVNSEVTADKSEVTSSNVNNVTSTLTIATTPAVVVLEEDELAAQINILSTKLLSSIESQSSLEDQVHKLNRELVQSKDQISKYEAEITALRHETEELTSSLFDEANIMVSTANRAKSATEREKKILQDQLVERDELLDSMQQQLVALKAVMQDINEETQRQREALKLEHLMSDSPREILAPNVENPLEEERLNQPGLQMSADSEIMREPAHCFVLNGPIRPNLREDLAPYYDFIALVPGLLNSASSSQASLSSSHAINHGALKDTTFYKRCLVEEIEPTLRLDIAPGLSWLSRRTVMSAIVEGTVTIEPISGVNESWSITNSNSATGLDSGVKLDRMYAYPSDGPPVAVMEPCTLCGETRKDSLVYARMYNLRILSKDISSQSRESEEGTLNEGINNGTASPINGGTGKLYPLCGYCVNRVRTVCDLLQFLKQLREGVWKLDIEDRQPCGRAWAECVRLRERMFWARVGGNWKD
ncbi:hypothetical protein NADFUDRAFT_47116 [Nadsonia fulvescens var. elongata DSM 6958]|uniref:GDP/GTP exchange factor Sec2 N-terminal domain-containing protein n=1 Tax=Nadsonia fulvescens var. elongata DSM 6958 TaxID=857566 RepID=A0A1E3PJE1_9ASCO|nr:hypothetical protein NADFUDRAFT_47116 [Nadsonia fulvescens var. elongata DSM 6958]